MADINPLISVIIPVYKVEQYLDRCLESVVNQTYKNLEIILVDDGSPDNCPAMCDDWAKKDERIRVIHKENGGLSSARNFGIDAAHGEYLTLIDSDDYVTDDMLMTLYQRIVTDKSDLALCNYLCVGDNDDFDSYAYENSLPIQDEVLSSSEAQKKLFVGMHWHYVIACCKLYRADLFSNFRYPLGKLHEDLHTTHLIFERCGKISCVKKPLYYYYQNGESITHTYSIRRLDAVDAYISRFDFFFKKGDYFCAIMSVQFMIAKLITAHDCLDLKDKQVSDKLKGYKKQYRKNLLKVLPKRTKGVDKLELISFGISLLTYRIYRAIKRRLINRGNSQNV